MSAEDPGDVSYNQVGGLGEQIRELREVSLICRAKYIWQKMGRLIGKMILYFFNILHVPYREISRTLTVLNQKCL